jgi:hypothetical protein
MTAAVEKIWICCSNSFPQRGLGAPAQPREFGDIQELLRRTVRPWTVENKAAAIVDHVGDELRELGDGNVLPGADPRSATEDKNNIALLEVENSLAPIQSIDRELGRVRPVMSKSWAPVLCGEKGTWRGKTKLKVSNPAGNVIR